jgi:exonuclease SbcD
LRTADRDVAPRLLCLADTQLGAHGRLADQAELLERVAGLAVGMNVAGVLHAGDVFEGPVITPEQLAVFATFVRTLHAAKIPVLAISGNGRHDLAVRETNGLAIFDHIPGIHVSSRPEVVPFAGCAVCTLPWVHPGRWIARHNGGGGRDQINQEVADLLLDTAASLRLQARERSPEWPAVLLAHWSVSGAALPSGLPTDQLREPVIPLDGLDEIGFDHVVLGHIHKPQVVGERGFYCGSPLPHDFGEADCAHGVAILHIGETEEIDFPGAEFVEIESRAFVTHDLDLTTSEGVMALASLPDVPAGAILRIRYRASADENRRLDPAAWRRELLEAGASEVRIEADIVREQRARVHDLDEQASELDALDRWLATSEIETELAEKARETMQDWSDTQ